MGYYVELKDDILNAINKAGIDYTKLKKIRDNLIPFSVLERACNLNLNNRFCNINLQYVWFCLNKYYVYRKLSTGWKKFKVSFSDTYVENSRKNRNIVLRSYNSCKKPKSKVFSEMCGKHYVSIREYISGKNKIPLSVFLKSCQLLRKDPWIELNNCKIYSGSSARSKFIIFKNRISTKLCVLLNWIKLEGNLNISGPRISISQNINEELCFEKLRRYCQEVFNIPKSSVKLNHHGKRLNILIFTINSAPLRQILNLRFGIPLGYKSRKVKPNIPFNPGREGLLEILASELETEGSFARHRKSNITHCDVSFSCYSKDYSLSVFKEFRELGYPVSFRVSRRERFGIKEREYRTCFWGCLKIQKFAFEIMPYFHHLNKIANLVEVIKQKNYLKITRINMDDKIRKLIYKTKEKCGSFKLLTERLNKEGLQISHKAVEAWVHQSNRISVYAILKMCLIIGKEDYFNYLPKELALSLWLHGFIDRETAENLRGIEKAYIHVDSLIKSGDRDGLVH